MLRGAFGPSDGSVGAVSNVPSALAVLRHAQLYLRLPEEIDEAFGVLEQHAIRHGVLYPVAVTIVPFLFDIVRRGTPVAERITDLIAEYASAASTLEPALRDQLLRRSRITPTRSSRGSASTTAPPRRSRFTSPARATSSSPQSATRPGSRPRCCSP